MTPVDRQLAWSSEESHMGIKVYRDNCRVLPYGEESDDWLQIKEKKARAGGKYYVTPRQVAGSIRISANDNPDLKDATNREAGIIGSSAFEIFQQFVALLHGPEQIADLPVPVAESPGAVRIGHPERSHLVEYLAPNSVFNSLPRQRSSPHLRPDDRLVTIDRVLHHASLGVA